MFSISNSGAIGIALIALSFYYSLTLRNGDGVSDCLSFETSSFGTQSVESQIANAWGRIISAGFSSQGPGFKNKSRIAVGINVNADLIVSGTAVLRKLGIAASGKAIDNAVIQSLADLEETFSFSLSNSAAIERSISSSDVFQKVLQAADSLEHKQYFVGGNAALAGLKMASTWDDLQVLMVGPCGPQVRDMLPDNVVIPETSVMATDEVHLIMEFKRQERWGSHEASVATRFITSYDVSNTEMTAIAGFADSVKEFSPDAVFFSGLHLLDGQPREKIGERIAALKKQLSDLPLGLPIHLELASMADQNLIQAIYQKVLSSVHSLGLNEQELAFLSSMNSGPHAEVHIREGYPEVGAVADILHWILTSVRRVISQADGKREPILTRVHFHSLAFHIVATVRGTWTNNLAAVSAGARIAGRQACDDGRIVDEKVELRVPRAFALSVNHPELRQRIVSVDPLEPVLSWTRDNVEFHFTPVLVCKHPVKTVGLGDAISSTGFLYSHMLPLS